MLKCEPGKHWFLIEALRRADQFAAPLGWTEIYVLRKFAGVVKRSDHGRTPVHEQIAKMYGQTTEYAQMEIFVARHAGRVGEGAAGQNRFACPDRRAPVLWRASEELFEVTVTTHPEGRYTYSMDMQRSLRPRIDDPA